MRKRILCIIVIVSLFIVIFGNDSITFEKYINNLPELVPYVKPDIVDSIGFDSIELNELPTSFIGFMQYMWNLNVKSGSIIISALANIFILVFNCINLIIPFTR